MRDRWLKFDTVVAICALLMSTLTAGAMVYQTRVIADQFSASTWPYLSVDTTYNPNNVEISLVNDGAGPLDLCYCSIGERCWTLHTTIGSAALSIPQAAASCGAGAAIGTPAAV